MHIHINVFKKNKILNKIDLKIHLFSQTPPHYFILIDGNNELICYRRWNTHDGIFKLRIRKRNKK
jgi:hypothetical protein